MTDLLPANVSISDQSPLLQVSSLSVKFSSADGTEISAVSDLGFKLESGRMLAIVGESGSGKTVSTRALLGLLHSSAQVAGSARFDGVELIGMDESKWRRLRGRSISVVQQNSSRSLNPTMRIGEQIVEAIRVHEPIKWRYAQNRAAGLLEHLGFRDPLRQFRAYPFELSGGMQQRVAIAIAIACAPRLLIADEPTRSLDSISQFQTLALLRRLQKEANMAIILITHDLRAVAGVADEVLVMYSGRVVEQLPASKIILRSQMRYTRALLDAAPSTSGPRQTTLPSVPASPPNYARSAKGCHFAPRCSYADSLCHNHRPTLTTSGNGHSVACWNPTPV